MIKIIPILPLLVMLFCSSLPKSKSDTTIKYVFAKSGLILRKKPELNSEPILTIPYGSKVLVSSDEPVGEKLEVESLNGYYRFVKFSENIGFIFDGFISTLIPPDSKLDGISHYFEKNYKKIKGPIQSSPNVDNSETKVYEIHYEKGIKLFTTVYLGGGYTRISIPNATINDGKLLLLTIYPKLKKVKFTKDKNSESFVVEIKDDTTGIEEYYDIRLIDTNLIISVGGET
ncbi:SH3 domain-containing protein [Leptospira interrogans]|uniref:SH3 domain-containing protein n=1 Tax=Leptospira interrogans TaxID=173 RepID=UPI0002B8C70B|nr:SH3 domain-containing protein [Leptospira interrogans]EMF73125.1 hypothetical protein LEP1GSC148_1917 [Leptospira interrogans serovar Canicola str. LT1962]EMM91874.1 hypothetical protein LEP1GSC145_0998 [Leptospira interrogans serovar Djasiman str. LT1649]